MRRAQWLLLSGAALAVLLLAGIWLIPPALDWNRFRPEIAALASDALGRRVRIDGPITLTLLPQPMFTAGKVSFAPGGDPIDDSADARAGRMTAAELRLGVTLESLFSGRVEAHEVVLRGVDLNLPWPPPADALVIRPPSWLSALSARIERGRVRIGGVEFTDVTATLATADATGTYNVAGTAGWSGRNWRFTAQLTHPGGDGAAGLSVTLDGLGTAQGVGLNLSGQITGTGAFAGRIAGRGGDLSQLMPGPAAAFRAEGRLSMADGLAVADELAGELGGAPVRGAVALRLSPAPRLDLALTANRLDLDGWWAALLRQGDADTLPHFTIGVDLSAEVAQFAGGAMRGLRAAIDVGNGVAELREVRATLPGETVLRAAGRIVLPAPHRTPMVTPRFEGFLAVSTLAPRTTLAWLLGAASVQVLPAGVLRQLDLAGRVVLEPGNLTLDGLSGTIDGATLSGNLAVRTGARLAVAAGLKLGRFDLDPFLPAWSDLPGLLGGFDVDLRLETPALHVGGQIGTGVTVDLAIEAGRLNLRKFSADFAGLQVAVSGAVHEGGRIADGKLALQVPGGALRGSLPASFRPRWLTQAVPADAPIWGWPMTVEIEAAGAPTALGLRAMVDIGDLRIETMPTLDIVGEKWVGSLTLRHPGAPRLAEALGVRGVAAWLGDGSLGLVTQISGQPGRIAADGFDLAAGSLHAVGSLVLTATPEGQGVTGRVTLDTLPLPLPYFRATQPLPWPDLSGWSVAVQVEAAQVLLGQSMAMAQARGQVGLAGGVLRIGGLTAQIGGGSLSGEVAIDTLAQPPRVMVAAQVRGAALPGPLFELPFDIAAGTIDLTTALTATGYSPGALLATLGGTMRIAARDGVIAGVALARIGDSLADADLRAGLAGGTTGFDRLTLDMDIQRGGVVLREALLAGRDGVIAATGGFDLPGAEIDMHLDMRPAIEDPPRIGLRVNGRAEAPQRAPELSDVIRWRAGKAP